jgi:hypothetical protein
MAQLRVAVEHDRQQPTISLPLFHHAHGLLLGILLVRLSTEVEGLGWSDEPRADAARAAWGADGAPRASAAVTSVSSPTCPGGASPRPSAFAPENSSGARASSKGRPSTPTADFTRPVTTGITANFITARAAARHMIGQGSGVILALENGSTYGSPRAP